MTIDKAKRILANGAKQIIIGTGANEEFLSKYVIVSTGRVARKLGLDNKISTIMQSIILYITKLIDYEKAKEDNVDIVLIDTAGRLQNKVNLMKELEKVNKVIGKHIPNAPHETLLVIDATTGQNGISQATAFKEITNITGIVLTKLDGTAKGGIVLAIKEQVGIPVKYIGLGERKEDLQVFDIEKYIYGLFKDMM